MVIVGSLMSSRSNGYLLRRIITGVVLLSGLKYVGLPIPALGVAALLVTGLIAFITMRHWTAQQRSVEASASLVAEPVQDVVAFLPTGLDGNL
jgi:hypothetical protein